MQNLELRKHNESLGHHSKEHVIYGSKCIPLFLKHSVL